MDESLDKVNNPPIGDAVIPVMVDGSSHRE